MGRQPLTALPKLMTEQSKNDPVEQPSLSADIPGFFDKSQEIVLDPPAKKKRSGKSHSETDLRAHRGDDDYVPPSFWRQAGGAIPTMAALALLAGAAFGFWFYVIGLPNPAADARALARAGKVSGVIQQLEGYVGTKEGDPKLHAALAYAYVQASSVEKALKQFKLATEKDTSVLESADVASLVGLLGTRSELTFDAQKLVERIGRPARPYLAASMEEDTADAYMRCRVGDTMRAIGDDIDIVALCAHALAGKSCNERRVVVKRLGELGDKRAVQDLERVAAEKEPSGARACGADEAEQAARALRAAK